MRALLGLAVAVLVAGCGSPAPIAEHKPPGASSSSTSASSASSSGTGGSHPESCTPGAQVACACVGGGEGAQVCNAEGTALGPCECPDAGTGGATSASSSSSSASSTSSSSGMPACGHMPPMGGGTATEVDNSTWFAWAYTPDTDIDVTTIGGFQVINGPFTWTVEIFADDGAGHPASPAQLNVTASAIVGDFSPPFHMTAGKTYWIGVTNQSTSGKVEVFAEPGSPVVPTYECAPMKGQQTWQSTGQQPVYFTVSGTCP